MHEDMDNKPTQVSRPAIGAPGANSASSLSASAERTPFDERIRRVQGAALPIAASPIAASPSLAPSNMAPASINYDLEADKQTEVGGGYRAVSSALSGDTVVIRPETEIGTVGIFFCRKGLRRGQLFLLRKARSEFGRAADCDVMIEDVAVSSHHGAFLLEDGVWQIFDFASANGTLVNNERVGKGAPNPRPLHDGDTITLGESEWVFKQID